MILKYGTYTHADNEVTLVISQRSTFNEVGARSGYVANWSIRGILQASTEANLRTAIVALEAAYGVDGRDLVLYSSDGTSVRHSMYNTGSRQGVRILDLSYPTGDGSEYTTFRTYQITAEAEYNNDLGILSYTESYTFGGGGQQKVVIPTLYGPPIEQLVRQQTPYTCQQQGTAVGVATWPSVPNPAFPSAEHRDRRRVTYQSPTRLGQYGNQMYSVQWAYEFESPSPLSGRPPG
jgi:hypothetical protein